ncbi:hypothetical protein RM190_06825 [Paracoccus sp. CPCC 101403]|uniref:RcnB family protein n=1 Tax=Paracoccus broussonetiae TaxID=3075834 RepID=A0ABU3EBH0_9RHOB|nr:hypothetical protein [Paracoccus sp. CPCC 101403]MDT1061568.1 hypothetical protein [Paracoccus sp. CPCC 101403]
MKSRIKRYSFAAALVLAVATMAFAQHLDPGDAQSTSVREASFGGHQPIRVGDKLDPAVLHEVSRPGLYGISGPPEGSEYGVIDGRLIRYDQHTLQVQSIIRQVDYVLD